MVSPFTIGRSTLCFSGNSMKLLDAMILKSCPVKEESELLVALNALVSGAMESSTTHCGQQSFSLSGSMWMK